MTLSWFGYLFVIAPSVRSSFRKTEEERIASYAHVLAVDTDNSIAAALRHLEALAALPQIRRMDPAALALELGQWDAVDESFLYFTVIDRDGRIVARPSKPERIGSDRAKSANYVDTKQALRTVVSEVRHSTAGNLSLLASTPIVDDQGRFNGVLSGSLGLMDRNVDFYRMFTRPASGSRPFEVFLISGTGWIIASSTARLGESVSDEAVGAGEPNNTVVMSDDGKRWIASSFTIPTVGWKVVVRIPEHVVDAEVDKIGRRATLITVGLLVVVLIAGVLAADRFARPLEKLTRAIALYGQGRPAVDLGVPGTGKVGEATSAFSLMRIQHDEAVAERERIATRMLHAQKLQTVGTLAGGIAHDFNNLLTPILLGASRLVRGTLTDDVQRQIAVDIEDSAERARDLISRILAFSRTSEPRLVPVDIAVVVRDALRLAAVSVPASVTLRPSIDDSGAVVLADATQLHQVILNLCSNAVDATTTDGGLIDVELARRDDDRVELTFRDYGTGIPPEILDRVFEPFFTTKPPGKGTGLGLSMVHGIVSQHDGMIAIESTPGRGTLIRITLPTVKATPCGPEARSQPPVGIERLLVVDDDRGVASAIAGLLEEFGYAVEVETAPRAALARISAGETYDLVVCDNNMPELSGLLLATAILEVAPAQRFLMITGSVDLALSARYAALGIVDITQKPITVDAMARAVRTALER